MIKKIIGAKGGDMRKIFALGLCVMLLSSCSYYKMTTIKLYGREISFPIGGISPVKGRDISGVITRQVYLMPGEKEPEAFATVTITSNLEKEIITVINDGAIKPENPMNVTITDTIEKETVEVLE